MSIIILLILISLSIAIIFLLIFYWSMKSGQYDDTYTPSVRMLFEDKAKKKNTNEQDKKQEVAKS
ncbi:MAG TPA: cbb3-type cytochrome oxidase assembly protein CcoS [Cyclobacteriaceae bacterium]|nr:cbb3-type cytochrome oxidase assembly protein CcoS [Cyclobacteriaceae bacterium]HRJ82857.1 cbb3-type cytochrome oxidase assembly protein CcoS [Cyclobacteriaceae bacterium]